MRGLILFILVGLFVFFLVLISVWAISPWTSHDNPPDWTGFDTYRNNKGLVIRAKTLWDWLDLLIGGLIVGGVLAIGGYFLNKSARDNDRKIAQDRQRQQTLENYFDRMSELILDKREQKGVRNIARTQTLSVLRMLDVERVRAVFGFIEDAGLREEIFLGGGNLKGVNWKLANLRFANLVGADLSNANLSNANLRGADLSGAFLSGADLSGADLRGAKLYRAKLGDADLSGARLLNARLFDADLSGANLSGANLFMAKLFNADLSGAKLYRARLFGAELRGADLRGADLSGAFLSGADLSGAFLSGAKLYRAKLGDAKLGNADLSDAKYDSQTTWPHDYDPKEAGARKERWKSPF